MKKIFNTFLNPICFGMTIYGNLILAICVFLNYDSLSKEYFLISVTIFVLLLTLPTLIFYPLINGKISVNTWNKDINYYLNSMPFSLIWSLISFISNQYYFIGGFAYLFGINGLSGFIELKHIKTTISIYLLFFISLKLIFDFDFILQNLKEITSLTIVLYLCALSVSKNSIFIKNKNKKLKRLLDSSKKDKKIIDEEKKKSEKLLLNILPKEISDELREKKVSKPKYYQSATVMFTDFVGFTKIADSISPEDLVKELDYSFSFFDSVTRKYNLEKIKTIGDSYMTCGGVPKENSTHVIDTILAAMEIQKFMNQTMDLKKQLGLPYWELRIGINTGPLVAGVIGEMKFSYDIFGDTVNTASRMESSGEKGLINISHNTYEIAKKYFICVHRGEIFAKNKGKIPMYFVERIADEFCIPNEQNVPNQHFLNKYKELSGKTITTHN